MNARRKRRRDLERWQQRKELSARIADRKFARTLWDAMTMDFVRTGMNQVAAMLFDAREKMMEEIIWGISK